MKASVLCGVIVALVHGSPLEAKCARMHIKVSGELAGGLSPDQQIAGMISPSTGVKMDKPTIEGNHFTMSFWFDPTRGYGPQGHDCSRDPVTVSVLLTRGAQVLQKQELKFDREFTLDKEGDYVLKKPLALGLKSEE